MTSRTLPPLALSLPVLFLKEKKAFIAYTPALDLSASGTTQARAKKNFETVLGLFLEEVIEAGTFEQVLKDMGWTKHEKKWQPPVELQKVSSVPFRVPVPA